MSDSSVGSRLAVLTLTLLAALVVAVGLNVRALGSLEASLRTVYLDRTVPAVDLATVADDMHRERYRTTLAAMVPADRLPSLEAEVRELDRTVDQTWAKYKATYLTPEEAGIAKDVERTLTDFRSVRDEVFAAAQRGEQEKARELVTVKARRAFDDMRDKMRALLDLQARVAKEEYEKGQAGYTDSVRSSIAVTAMAVLLGALLAAWIIRSVTTPLNEVKRVLEHVRARGDLSVRAAVTSHDEIGRTAEAVNGVLADLDGLVSSVGDVMRSAERGDFHRRVDAKAIGDLARIQSSINEALTSLEAILGSVDRVMKALAEGDLRARVDVEAQGQLAAIKANVNGSLDRLDESFAQLARAIRQVASATQEASSAVGQVSDGAHHQLTALKQVAVGMTQTSQAVIHVTTSARESSELANDATSLVADGAKDVDAMVTVVSGIREHSEHVTRITDVISQLASQTNMLSLNAAIEAARAGEHGKGFAVVAEQVGRLAESSGKSVKEIVELVGRATKESQHGVEVAGSVRGAIDSIASRVNESQKRASSIATAMEEQQAAIAEINASVGDLTRIGQSNASAAEELAATMVELSQVANQTRATIDRFRTR
jgi:methyl-accepting chemotaxis protein